MYNAYLTGHKQAVFISPKVQIQSCASQNDFPIPQHVKMSFTMPHSIADVSINTTDKSIHFSNAARLAQLPALGPFMSLKPLFFFLPSSPLWGENKSDITNKLRAMLLGNAL